MENQTEKPLTADIVDEKSPIEGEYYPAKEMLELEKERIKSADKRTEIARLAIESNDAADKRMFEYHMSKLDRDTQLKSKQLHVAQYLIYGGGLFVFLLVFLLFGMSFYGDAHQSQIASGLLEKVVTALSGIGIYLLGKGAYNKLTEKPEE